MKRGRIWRRRRIEIGNKEKKGDSNTEGRRHGKRKKEKKEIRKTRSWRNRRRGEEKDQSNEWEISLCEGSLLINEKEENEKKESRYLQRG